MLLIGLTGSIATGKSTVSTLLSQPPHSLPVIDADLLARKVVEPGTRGYAAILAHFSPTTPDLLLPASDSTPEEEKGVKAKGRPLNRAALGRRVFGDGADRKRDRAVLNGIVHPAVRWEMVKAAMRYYVRGHWAIVLDIPLLFESGLDTFCGVAIVVAVRDPEVQMQRLRARDAHLSAEEAADRVRSQGDVREKAKRAEARGVGRGAVVWNDSGREELAAKVNECLVGLQRQSPRWWGWVLLGLPPLGMVMGLWGVLVNWRAKKGWERGVQREKAKL